MLLTTVRQSDRPSIQLGMEIPSFSRVMGRVEHDVLRSKGYVAPTELLTSRLAEHAHPETLSRIVELLKSAQKHYDQNGNILEADSPEAKALGLPGKNGRILTLPRAEVSLGSIAQDGIPNFERVLHGDLYTTDYLVNWAFQRVGKEYAAKTDGILFKEDGKKLASCSVGSVNVSLTAFVNFQNKNYLLGHKKSGEIMVQPGQVHGSLLPGGVFGGHMDDIHSHIQNDDTLPVSALSEALIHHAASKWGITKDEFRSGVVMDSTNPLLISELVELGYFQFGFIAQSLDPKMLEEMLLKENSKDPSLKMTELVLIPIGTEHEVEKMWSVTAERDGTRTHLVMTPNEVFNNSSFVGYARAIRDAAVGNRWFPQVIANNALPLEDALPIKVKSA